MEHTPGPWRVGASDRDVYDVATDKPIAWVNAPNARLIAAAPDLLAALEAAWPGLSGQSYERPISEVHEMARVALAKAKGLPGLPPEHHEHDDPDAGDTVEGGHDHDGLPGHFHRGGLVVNPRAKGEEL